MKLIKPSERVLEILKERWATSYTTSESEAWYLTTGMIPIGDPPVNVPPATPIVNEWEKPDYDPNPDIEEQQLNSRR